MDGTTPPPASNDDRNLKVEVEADDALESHPYHVDGDGADTPTQAQTPTQGSPTVDHVDGAKPAIPLQKRRRVTRACDECRRKKIKCDGKQPCTHCQVYSYECTYDQPSNRRRNAAPQYIEALESKLKRAEALLRVVLPNVDLNDPNLDNVLLQGQPSAMVHGHARQFSPADSSDAPPPSVPTEPELDSMLKAAARLDLDEQGHWDYHGDSSGISFMAKMREHLKGWLGTEAIPPNIRRPRPMSQVFESPKSTHDSPLESPMPLSDLPPREVALSLCDLAVNDATSLLRFVHWPSFVKSLDKIYDPQPAGYGNEENTFLPLLYAVMAFASLYSRDEDSELVSKGYDFAIDNGFKYYRASRQLLDIADCRDLQSLQAILFMILFLQSSAKLSTCYSFIGVALRSALRMGLHRSFQANFNPIEAEVRKRVFSVIQRMDMYVGALLGLPHLLNDEDVDQDLPVEVDDEYITENGIMPMPEGTVSVIAAGNQHTKLCTLLGKVVRYIYPLKGEQSTQGGAPVKSYRVPFARIREIEADLQDWMEQLPMGLRPGGEAPERILRLQQALRLSYAHTQMMLYRPFLHYVSHTCKSGVVDKRSFACAAACVSVSRNIIHITIEMKRRHLLIGAYWFQMYTTFFAILSLIFYALENPDGGNSRELLKDARQGKDTLESLAKRSMAADRCSQGLKGLFENLPENLKRGRRQASAMRKRRHDISPKTAAESQRPVSSSALGEADALNHTGTPHFNHTQPIRASTFPHFSDLQDSTVDKPHAPNPNMYNSPAATPFLDTSSSNFNVPSQPTNTTASTPLNTPGVAYTPQEGTNSYPISPMTSTFPDTGTPFSPDASQAPNPALPDFSSMMFPTSDPFAYPSQNLSVLPPSQFGDFMGDNFNSPNTNYMNFTGQPTANGNPGGAENPQQPSQQQQYPDRNQTMQQSDDPDQKPDPANLDVQLFGPMPIWSQIALRVAFFKRGQLDRDRDDTLYDGVLD
ncbi:hypothetical protein P152DRAFT_467583 [Eremomyces bilateralis CBS 781.70]|uniref:Zn(2)-C6 fungal-type domain-containing protein n=1 Tax=Eremomyces bilateralis CBS 781.70 TaxID=1392243 RepID=A0A6G1FYN2_9PEZI|nr:uncharacterized protein P152DRAFT_467583 [Eremomyces bilateralis CBS 781.70]KAF1810878.1 hypothetical protein P152DRAFT_467583 [Eremomyces bilateralis CBS 781.70]